MNRQNMTTKKEVLELLKTCNLTAEQLEELYQMIITAKPELAND
jgi:hypothetical protein